MRVRAWLGRVLLSDTLPWSHLRRALLQRCRVVLAGGDLHM